MVETTEKSLVRLVLGEVEGSNPKLYIAGTVEEAINPVMLTNITLFRYQRPDFTADGTDDQIKKRLIQRKSEHHLYANAYIGTGSLSTEQTSYTAAIYFHINEEQAKRASEPKNQI